MGQGKPAKKVLVDTAEVENIAYDLFSEMTNYFRGIGGAVNRGYGSRDPKSYFRAHPSNILVNILA